MGGHLSCLSREGSDKGPRHKALTNDVTRVSEKAGNTTTTTAKHRSDSATSGHSYENVSLTRQPESQSFHEIQHHPNHHHHHPPSSSTDNNNVYSNNVPPLSPPSTVHPLNYQSHPGEAEENVYENCPVMSDGSNGESNSTSSSGIIRLPPGQNYSISNGVNETTNQNCGGGNSNGAVTSSKWGNNNSAQQDKSYERKSVPDLIASSSAGDAKAKQKQKYDDDKDDDGGDVYAKVNKPKPKKTSHRHEDTATPNTRESDHQLHYIEVNFTSPPCPGKNVDPSSRTTYTEVKREGGRLVLLG